MGGQKSICNVACSNLPNGESLYASSRSCRGLCASGSKRTPRAFCRPLKRGTWTSAHLHLGHESSRPQARRLSVSSSIGIDVSSAVLLDSASGRDFFFWLYLITR